MSPLDSIGWTRGVWILGIVSRFGSVDCDLRLCAHGVANEDLAKYRAIERHASCALQCVACDQGAQWSLARDICNAPGQKMKNNSMRRYKSPGQIVPDQECKSTLF